MFGIMFGGFVLHEFWLAIFVLLALWGVVDLADRALDRLFPRRAAAVCRVRYEDEILELDRFGEIVRRYPALEQGNAL